MLDAIARIEDYSYDKDLDHLKGDSLLQDGLVRQLSIIGEAARRIPAETQKENPDIPWSDIIGMRHILVHDYFQVDLAEVWKTATSDIPTLKPQLQKLQDKLT